MAQEIDLVAKKKNTITVSSLASGTMSGLTAVHTVKFPFSWFLDNSSSEWINFTTYELLKVKRIVIKYNGTAATFLIEKSLDGFNWETVTDTFIPDQELKEADVTYTEPVEFIFFRVTLNTLTSNFSVYKFEIYADVIVENKTWISHNFYTLYGQRYREDNPRLPSFTKNLLEMWEAGPDIDLKIFEASQFSSATLNKVISSNGNTITLSTTGIPVFNNTRYIWDFGDPNTIFITGDDGIIDLSTSDIQITTSVDFSTFTVNQFVGDVLEIRSGITNKREFIISANTANDSSTGNTITLDSADPFTLSETDVDFQIKEITQAVALVNPNIINTSTPLVDQSYTYSLAATYYPRLVLVNPKYVLEFVQSIVVA